MSIAPELKLQLAGEIVELVMFNVPWLLRTEMGSWNEQLLESVMVTVKVPADNPDRSSELELLDHTKE